MTLEGKGFFIWKIKNTEGGVIEDIADLAVESHFTHILVKVADGAGSYNIDPKTGQDRVGPLVEALRDRGISVWGWQYVYGYDPIGEADKAIQRIQEHNLDGFAVDAEAEYKAPGKARAARQYMARLNAGLPTTPIALSSYRYPSYHPQIPWDEFLARCDIAMPQVYWALSSNPGEQLQRTVNEYQSMNYIRPVIPTGCAYQQGDWAPTPRDQLEFLTKARELDLSAVNYWEWAHTRKYLPEVWETIGAFDWSGERAITIGEKYIKALNTHDIDKIVGLYKEEAVHVSSRRTIQGKDAIREWYQELFSKILPNAVFRHNNSLGKGPIRHVTWTAVSSAGSVEFGSDSMGISSDGKFNYHYTFFVVT